MNGPFIWWVFCIPPPIRMLLLCILFSTRLYVLSRQCQPFSSQATCFLHVQGVGFVTRTTLSTSSLFKPLDYRSFEAVEMRLSFDQVSVPIVCLYRPPPSKRNKLTNSMFLEEFSELLSQYASSRSDIVYIGDFNFHYDDCSDGQVNRLRTIMSDHNLTQLVTVWYHP